MDSYFDLRGIVRKKNLLAHFSIWTLVAIVLTISLTVFKNTLFGITYLALVLSFLLIFQSSFSFWARCIKIYCLVLVVYSISVTLLTYSFQFEAIRSIYKNLLLIPDELLKDIGLIVRTSGWMLFLEPFVPLVLTILLVLYIKIFNDDFTRFAYLAEEPDASLSRPLTDGQYAGLQSISDPTFIMLNTSSINEGQNNPTEGDTQTSEAIEIRPPQISRSGSLANAPQSHQVSKIELKRFSKKAKLRRMIDAITECIWRLLETHFIKLVLFIIFWVPVIDVCLLNLPFLLIVIFAFRYPSRAKCSCLAASWFSTAVIIIRSLSNLTIFKSSDITSTCTSLAPNPLKNGTFSLIEYIGASHEADSPLNKIDSHLWILALVTIYCFIVIHYERRDVKDYELSFGVIFTGIGRREADLSVTNAIKYVFNFGFYKFGLEITCIALIVAISNRLDFIAAIYGLILMVVSVATSKRTLSTVWPIFTVLVCLIIPTEYILRLGLPKPLCQAYPWDGIDEAFKVWFYLPDYETVPDVRLLLFDFLVLLTICRQSVIFRHMKMNASPSMALSGQSHQNLTAHQFRIKYLPTIDEFAADDCFSNYTTLSSYVKSTFFVSIYWITLAVVLVAGATKISLFSLGYLIGCLLFLWLGNDTYLMPIKRLIFSWNYLIFYATLVILFKVLLQLYTCYLHTFLLAQHCYVLQLLRVACYRKLNDPTSKLPKEGCAATLPYDELDILWDGLCLIALLIQRIVFGSRYFRYLVLEVKAQQILASRGAELIMATQIEEAKAQALYEKEVMRSVREKLENLKLDNEETSKAWQRLLNLPHHHQIIRNADRHLFSSTLDEPVSQIRTNDWKFKKAFIPDPLGDELERMAEINGISAVFTRWMKGQPLYGSPSQSRSTNSPDVTRVDEAHDEIPPDVSVPSLPPIVDGDPSPQVKTTSRSIEADLDEEDSTDEEIKSEETRLRGCWSTFNLILYSCLLSVTVELNKLSRSYRYVSRRMDVEKNILKSKFNLDDERFKRDPTWRKMVISTLSDTYTKTNSDDKQQQSTTSLHRIRSALKLMASAGSSSQDSPGFSQGDQATPISSPTGGSQKSPQSRTELTDFEYHFLKLNMFTQFFRAVAYVFISNTSLLCQLIIIFNQIMTASLLSLPLPLLTFLWGTLSVPRPTKRFWKTVITYTELVIVIKYIYQFPIWNFDAGNLNPFYYPNLLGIRDITILYDLSLLLALFFHRSMLKSLGQWDASAEQNLLLEQAAIATNADSLNNGNGAARRKTSYSLTRNITLKSDSGGQSGRDTSEAGLTMSVGASSSYMSTVGSPTELKSRTTQSMDRSAAIQEYNEFMRESYQNGNVTSSEQDGDSYPYGFGFCRYLAPIYFRIRRSISLFFAHVLDTPYKVQTDVYVWMFLCDFINFLILIYGFWAFGSGYRNQTVANFLDENRIPISVLIMLLAQFASIIVDRAFYLQKNIGGKLTFQVILVIGIHFWLFFALPFTTGHTLTLKEYWPPKAWYFFKSIYFLLSALQIRSGYPRRVLGNCFTKGYGYANWGVFKVYRAIPLVYDLRLYMDWIWTETTLEFRNWSIMEDMFANLFIRKCELTLEDEYPNPRAKPMRRISKYLTGGAFILLILAIIWGPLLLFSMGKTVGESNPPVEMEYELEFVGFQPILRMRATAQQITVLNMMQFDLLKKNFSSQASQTFLSDYNLGDVAAIKLDGQSNAVWEISPPSKQLLMKRIKGNDTLTLKSSWSLLRVKKEKSQNFDANIVGSYQKEINDTEKYKDFRERLYEMLDNSSTTKTPTNQSKFVVTPPIFPNYIRVPETGQANLLNLVDEGANKIEPLRPLHLSYIRVHDESTNMTDNSTSWWRADDMCKYNLSDDYYSFWRSDQLEHCDALVTVTFSDRIFTGILAVLSAPGIIGLYTTFVVFFARLIRSEPAGKVIYTEMPKVDRIYGLIMDIYMMRECGEFELEEKLFAKLLFLYRTPEMLIDWSRREDELDQLAD